MPGDLKHPANPVLHFAILLLRTCPCQRHKWGMSNHQEYPRMQCRVQYRYQDRRLRDRKCNRMHHTCILP